MKIAVFGATGRVGSYVTTIALEAGWQVKALVRTPEKTTQKTPEPEVIKGDIFDKHLVEKTIAGCDAVFVGLGTDKTNTLSTSAPHIVAAMKKHGVMKAVIIGTAGILDSRHQPGKYRFETPESKRKTTTAAEEHLKAYQIWKASGLEWTYVCPTYLPDGEPTGEVRYEADLLPEDGTKITVGDTARFAFRVLHDNQFVRQRIGICY
ncbi:oxidoreductase [Thalassobacillus devorans]|uniref:Oxidoreductase n=1 Tax=Thalassobacillus devorans TaxID=279813 RepID=A0ABQ1NEB5_9BACI|nr:SDR family oxidoreductase [Thalassobacillus devorans]NIK26945.1 putative NADH-flavin reductase [Thalassobacillus devorans]GGC73648.1 oxidoreductase [Thalassobacillus devorans]